MTAWKEAKPELERKVERMRRARQRKGTAWMSLVHVGALGWMLVLPVLAGVGIGYVFAKRFGHPWPAALGLALGLCVGVYVVWRSVDRSLAEDDDEGGSDAGAPGEVS
ncbi:MAG: AtpZ/AtpI family protein [Myxococcales bacterium]|nr:AtpZ/AtpI family protein [Myxococcales bacterium]